MNQLRDGITPRLEAIWLTPLVPEIADQLTPEDREQLEALLQAKNPALTGRMWCPVHQKSAPECWTCQAVDDGMEEA